MKSQDNYKCVYQAWIHAYPVCIFWCAIMKIWNIGLSEFNNIYSTELTSTGIMAAMLLIWHLKMVQDIWMVYKKKRKGEKNVIS